MECQGYQTFTFLNRTYCSTFSSLAPVDYWVYAQAVHWQWLKVEGVKDIIFSIIKISHTSGAPSIKEQLPNALRPPGFFCTRCMVISGYQFSRPLFHLYTLRHCTFSSLVLAYY